MPYLLTPRRVQANPASLVKRLHILSRSALAPPTSSAAPDCQQWCRQLQLARQSSTELLASKEVHSRSCCSQRALARCPC